MLKEYDEDNSSGEAEITQVDDVVLTEDFDEQEYAEMSDRYNDLDHQYQHVKNDIEMSRTPEEQAYWQRRGDAIWEERDRLGGEMEALNNKRNKK